MCGIATLLSKQPQKIIPLLYQALCLLQNRGYDSAGWVAWNQNQHEKSFFKFASSPNQTAIEYLDSHAKEEEHKLFFTGLAHTRWCTHGGKTDSNAHPHFADQIYAVHNGIIHNYLELKQEVIKRSPNYSWNSQTDSECLVAYLASQQPTPGDSSSSGLSKHVLELFDEHAEGSWAWVMGSTNYPQELWIAKNGSSLLLGYDDQSVFVCSEAIAFQQHVQVWTVLPDHALLHIFIDQSTCSFMIHDIRTQQIVPIHCYSPTTIIKIPKQIIQLKPHPYEYWMEKEIHETDFALKNTLNFGGRLTDGQHVLLGGLEPHSSLLLTAQHIVLIGCGSSFYASQTSLPCFKDIAGFVTCQAIDATELTHQDFPANQRFIALFVSQSGESKDVVNALKVAKQHPQCIATLGIVNVVGSYISRETTCGIYLNSGREVSVCATKSFSCQVLTLWMLSHWFFERRQSWNIPVLTQNLSKLLTLPTLFSKHNSIFQKDAQQLVDSVLHHHSGRTFLLGKNMDFFIASEAALKIKEVADIHCEAFTIGSLKHGPLALCNPQTIVFIVVTKESDISIATSCIEELQARKVNLILVTSLIAIRQVAIKYSLSCVFSELDQSGFQSLVFILWFQWVAFYWGKIKKCNIDQPNHLSKTVTVI